MIYITVDRIGFLLAIKRLQTVSSSFNAEVLMKQHEGKLALSVYTDGFVAVELLNDNATSLEEDVVLSLDKVYTFFSTAAMDTVTISISEKTVSLKSGTSKGRVPRSVAYLNIRVPNESELVGSISSDAFDDLARVANISEDKTGAVPLFNGVLFTINPGAIYSMATNGIASGYAWEVGEEITASKNEKLLIPATAVQIAQRYDWQGEKRISIYRPPSVANRDSGMKMVCFSNGSTYLFMSELNGKEKYPYKYIVDASADAVSKYFFVVPSGLFKSFVNASIKLSGYDDRSVTVCSANGNVSVSSGKRLPHEVENSGQEFMGFSENIEAYSGGDDFTVCLDAKIAKQAIGLLSQIDKGGQLRVSLGEKTNLIFFSTSSVSAIYAVAQIAR